MVWRLCPNVLGSFRGKASEGELLLGQCSLGELSWIPAKSNGRGRRSVVTRQGRNAARVERGGAENLANPNGSSQIKLLRKGSPEVEFVEGVGHGNNLPRKAVGEREAHHTGYEPIVQTPWS